MDGDWLACEVTIDGTPYRFGPDEADPGDIPSSISFDTQNPGGDGDASVVVHRPDWATKQALLLCQGRIYGPGGKTRYSGRVKDVSQVSLDSVRIDFEGMAAHLDDNEFFRFLGVHNDLSAWGEPSIQRKLNLIGSGHVVNGPSVQTDTTGMPALTTPAGPKESAANKGTGEALLYVDGLPMGALYHNWKKSVASMSSDANWVWAGYLSDDDTLTVNDNTGDLQAAGPGAGSLTATTSTRKYAAVQLVYTADAALNDEFLIFWTGLPVFGTHGLTPRELVDGRYGLRGSDALRYALAQGAPAVTFTDESIEDSTFDFVHLVHTEGTLRDLIETITAHGTASEDLADWGVYEGEFFWRSPGSGGRLWRVRRDQVVVPNEEGPTADERFGEIVVEYTDGAGKDFTVGPPGSGADTEDDRLRDSDETNPALKVPGLRARKNAGITYEAGAILLGQAWLAEQNANTRRGSATIQGEATDEAGNVEPACAVRACDRLMIEDEEGVAPEIQPINSTSYDHDSLTVNANLGAAPHHLDVILAQLHAGHGTPRPATAPMKPHKA